MAKSSLQWRLIQHRREANWFCRFLSIVYDRVVNIQCWTPDMRATALAQADLNDPDLAVVDVGGGTGLCSQTIVKTVKPSNVTILDQSPHQLARAREKPDLKGCTIIEGDAQDRYVSAGSIEYWPDPQRGVTEAYRVLKKGEKACMIGPIQPTFWLSSIFADMWTLFPTEEEYMEWFTKAGFVDVKIMHVGPRWYRGVRRHGLIIGCVVTAIKPQQGDSPLQLKPKVEDEKAKSNMVLFLYRMFLGVQWLQSIMF